MFHDPTFWFLVAFVIFIAAIWRPVGRGTASALDSRADKIRSELDEAEKLRVDAKDLLASYQRKQRDAAKEAEAIRTRAGEEVGRMRVRAAADLERLVARREQMAIERIEMAEASAISDIRSLAVDIAVDAASSLIEASMQGDRANTMIESSIKDLSDRLH
ncbi:MAG: F0F1 ATP synthase subunit B family protein [Rhodospirillales bacterium]